VYKNKTSQEYQKEWRFNNKEYVRKCKQKYYSENKDRINENRKGKPITEKEKQYKSKWYFENKTRLQEQKRNYYLKNQEKLKEKQRQYQEKNKEKISENRKIFGYNKRRWEENHMQMREYCQKRRLRVFNHYSGNPPKCACCGEREIRFLTIDHINNDGAEHRKTANVGGGQQIIGWLIKNDFPEGFQILCYNCNMAKGHYGECPHKEKKLC